MINLLIVGNKHAAKGLLIIALSFLKYNDSPVSIHFLTMDHSHANPRFVPPSDAQIDYVRKLLQQHNPASDIFVYDIGEEFRAAKWHRKFNRSSYTPYALLRLFSDKLDLPDKVLYLDTDTFILGDIKPLYETEMGDHEFAACYDQLGTFWINPNYQNSGVLLMNMKRIKETDLLHKCREYLKKHHPILADQSALNAMVLKKQFLPQIYNEQKHSHDDTVIRHFSKTLRWIPFFHTLNVKPWDVDRIHKVDDYSRFQDVLEDFLSRKEKFEQL